MPGSLIASLSFLLTFILSITPALVFADNLTPSPWQGEWLSSGGKRSFGMTIQKCADAAHCEVSLFELSGYSASCLREGPAELLADGKTMKAGLKERDSDETPSCALTLERTATADGDTVVVKRSGNSDCDVGSCLRTLAKEDNTFRRQSSELYLRQISLWGECFRLTSPAGHLWCTDSELQSLIARAPLIPYAHADWSWKMDKALLGKCDGEQDVKGCLHREFQSKIDILEAQAKAMAETYGEPGDSKEAKRLLDKIGGVYKHQFKNADVAGRGYDSEDVFEIVPVSDSATYVNIKLNFFNGHICGAAGIMEYKKSGGFVFLDPEVSNRCLLTLKLEGGNLIFEDPDGGCQERMCGARGSFAGTKFPLKDRRTIRYMPIILKSEAYQESLKYFQSQHAEKASDAKN